ncbi:putative sensor histidine kinase with a CHASE3 and a response regulator receiver domain; signal peptide [Bradyrhizobium sp. ORS 285]|uniref:CHASE3 domain-containing protein n=1 Tax=Bradyrhizobium sp. ORS 285 TaxID=115808 RepID=UPI000240A5D9|nr:CHASE3 domain-containing protein [Bradyrhizobium sp. ORS 285]CCD86450.1 putative sensor histidine kinase with a CHASE3 and a response regulator receiver domain; signal peptide [Bradyrhizobium sp. ORS 285]SMX58792.1 putative sensor histidine kinase with a CHASE3 and a response regulator receiver domain; signal peptide [Bradyrhizobium sp. ORS 285]
MIRRRVAIGLGLGTLLAVGAASTALDLKARSETAWVEHTMEVLEKASELRLLLRQAEAASRGFALSRAEHFATEFQETSGVIPGAWADLRQLVADNPEQSERLQSIDSVVPRRIELAGELIRLQAANDREGLQTLMANAAGPAAMATINDTLDAFSEQERRLLAERGATSRRTGSWLLAIDLAGVAIVLAIAAYLVRRAYLSDRALRTSLTRSQATATSLEAQALQQRGDLAAAYDELRRSSAILETTFNSMAEGVLVVDPEGTIMLSNQAAGHFLGTAVGKTFGEMLAANRFYESDAVTRIDDQDLPIARALRGLSFDRREVVVKPTDGRPQFRLMVSGRPLRNSAGAISGAALVYHDVTEVHEIERLLQQAQKLDAIGKLTGGVAHDFNNMLTIITGSIEMLIDTVQDRPAAAELAVLISRAADRCTELIRHLLAFARKQPLRPRDIDVNATVDDIAKLLRPTLGEQVEIRTILADGDLIAHVDSAQLANSLVNMAINARDAMPDGGKLLLETTKTVLDEAYATANPGVVPGSYVMVAVSDTGAGMPAEVRDRAFEPFFTTKDAGKGSGLGLSMVYGFVKQSGGHIKLYSEENSGTTIRLYLPAAQRLQQAEPEHEQVLPRGTETILVVEDDPLVRDFVLAQLQGLGYATLVASQAAEALTIVARDQPFDLLFTDVIMPGGISGSQLAETITATRPGLRVLYTSGYTDNAIIENRQLLPDALLLTKPYRRTELAQMVRRALDGARAGDAIPALPAPPLQA